MHFRSLIAAFVLFVLIKPAINHPNIPELKLSEFMDIN